MYVETNSDILVLGVGNYLMGDEGLGVHLAQALEKEMPLGLADVLDGGTAGFSLMGHIESYKKVIMVDATLDDKPPGTVRLIRPKFSMDFPKAMSTHEIGLKDLVEALSLLGKLPDVYLYIVSVKTIQPLSISLSPEVSASLEILKQNIFGLCHKLQNLEINVQLDF